MKQLQVSARVVLHRLVVVHRVHRHLYRIQVLLLHQFQSVQVVHQVLLYHDRQQAQVVVQFHNRRQVQAARLVRRVQAVEARLQVRVVHHHQ